ncbi:MAG: ATP-binding protein [bacterium]
MKFHINNISQLIKESLIVSIPDKYKKDFEDVLVSLNLPRIKFVNIFVLIISCVLMTIARNQYYLYMYIVLFVLMLLWFVLLFKSKPGQKRIKCIKISYNYIVPLLLMLWGLGISFQDNDLAAFIIIVCINSMIVIRSPLKTLSVYLVSYILFLSMAPSYFSDNYLMGYYINATILFVFSIITSRMLFSNKLNEFVNTKIVENKKDQLEGLYDELKIINKEMNKKTDQLQTLFDNVEQGFLTLTEELIIEEQFSHECFNIFGENIAGRYYPELIFPDNHEQRELVENILNKALELENVDANIYLSLLPEESQVNNKQLETHYKTIENSLSSRYMVILKDVTEKKSLQSKMEEEKETLRMVLQAVVYYNDFFECIRNYQEFCNHKMYDVIKEEQDKNTVLIKIFKALHTYKGNFYQLHMKNIAEKIHDFEDKLNNLTEKIGVMKEKELINYFKGVNMASWLDKDITLLKEILGEKFFHKENLLMIDADSLSRIEEEFFAVLSESQCEFLIPEIRRIRYKLAKDMFETYKIHIERLSTKLYKSVNPLQIHGGEMLICPEKYKGFIKSLVHLFRNSMDHGIECVEERLRKGKDAAGNITCEIYTLNEKLIIIIADDGRGIDPEIIKKKAVKKGIYSKEELDKLPETDVIQLIFKEQFSTCQKIGDLSGRGLGLSAVKNEVDKLGGSIQVITEKEVGTKFKFFLPYQDINYISEVPAKTIMDYFVEKVTISFKRDLDIFLTNYHDTHIRLVDNITLNKHTIALKVIGNTEYIFLLSTDTKMALKILYNIYIGEVGEQIDKYLEDAMSEMLNVVVGNIIKKIFRNSDEIVMGTPKVRILIIYGSIK